MSRLPFVLFSACCALLLGCDAKPGLEGVVPVQGTVTYNGEPVEGATVTFMPSSAGGKAAVGKTDDSGHFTLTTQNPGDGALPGDYLITVRKTETSGGLSGEEAQQWVQENPGTPPPSPEVTHLLPERYSVARDSGLRATITADGENDIPLELED